MDARVLIVLTIFCLSGSAVQADGVGAPLNKQGASGC